MWHKGQIWWRRKGVAPFISETASRAHSSRRRPVDLRAPFIAFPHQLSLIFPVTLGMLFPPLVNPVLDRFLSLGAPGRTSTNILRLRGTALFPLSYGRRLA